MFKKRKKCETPVCNNKLSDDPYFIVLGDHQFTVCDDCANIMGHMQDKMEELEASLPDESL